MITLSSEELKRLLLEISGTDAAKGVIAATILIKNAPDLAREIIKLRDEADMQRQIQ